MRGRAAPIPNVIAPEGVARPRPQYLLRTPAGEAIWLYRGREIKVSRGPRGWWADIEVQDPPVAKRLVEAGVQGDVYGLGPAPDAPAVLKYGVFTVDAHERLAQGMTELLLASTVVGYALQDLTYEGTPLTRAAVARTIEIFRDDGRYKHEVAAFMSMPLQHRIELIDEMLEIAEAWGGRYPNPDLATKASLLS